MELTKKEIQLIDDYLKNKYVKYWDLRLEIIDHIASEIEDNNIKLTSKYLQEKLPYYKITKLIKSKKYLINRKSNRLYKEQRKLFFKSPFKMTLLLCWNIFIIWIYNTYKIKGFLLTVLVLIIMHFLIASYFGLKNIIKGNRSFFMEMIFNKWIGSWSLFYLLMQLYRFNFQKQIVIALMFLLSIFTFLRFLIGYAIYKEYVSHYSKIYNDYKIIQD